MNPYGRPSCDHQLLSYLKDHPESTAKQMEVHFNLTPSRVRHALIRLRKQGKIHVARWEIHSYNWSGLYVLGPGEDAVRVPHTRAELLRRYTKGARSAEKATRGNPIIKSGPFAGLGA